VRPVHRTLMRLALVPLFLASVTACRAPRDDNRFKWAPKVRVGYLPYLANAPVFIATAEGYFREQGLDVELVNIPISEGVAPLVRGDIDATTHYIHAGFFNAIARGSRIRIVADKGHEEPGACASDALVARRGLESTQDANWLRGRVVALRPSSIEEFWIERYLASAGLTWRDVVAKEIPASVKLDALANGTIDAAAWSEPNVTQAERRGVASLAVSAASVVPNLQWAGLAFGKRLLDTDRDVGWHFMVAYLNAVRQYNQGKTDRNVAILAEATTLPIDVVRDSCWNSIRNDGMIDLQSILQFEQWAKDRGFLDEVLPPERFWEPHFVDAARRALASGTGR